MYLDFKKVSVINWKMAVYYPKLVFTVYTLLSNITPYCTFQYNCCVNGILFLSSFMSINNTAEYATKV
jgi:hypothetical protein